MSKKAVIPSRNSNSNMLNRAFNNNIIIKNEQTGELSPIG